MVDNFSTRIARGDRLGFVGPNGVGKTTLVNMLTGKLEPDSGTVKLGSNVDMLVIDQKRVALDPNATVKDTLTGGGTDVVAIGETRKHVMAYMKDFLFLPEQAGTAVSRLSGGERGRLMLAMHLRHPSNLLVLDEPTNDLDLETLDLLQEMIADYVGTVLVVSHDRDFLDRVCTAVITPAQNSQGEWIEFAGGYSDMVSQRGATPAARASVSKERASAPLSSKEISTAKPATSKMSFKDKHALETLPKEIEKLEGDIAKVNKALAEAGLFEKNPKRFNQLVKLLEKTQAKLNEVEEHWMELEMMREELES